MRVRARCVNCSADSTRRQSAYADLVDDEAEGRRVTGAGGADPRRWRAANALEMRHEGVKTQLTVSPAGLLRIRAGRALEQRW
jgi:hypothetical protein